MSEFVMAIDAGTTGITALIIDERGNVAKKAYSEFPQHFPRPGWVEHDPVEIWDATQKVMAEVDVKTDRIAAVGITNQRETTVVWDKSTLQPVHNAIVWQCRRSAGICEELVAKGYADLIRERTGLVVDAYFSGTKLTWLMREFPEIRKRARAGELAFGTVDSWLVARLGGEHVTDFSNASRTLLYNVHDLEWDSDLLDLMEVPHQMLPAVLPSSGRFATTPEGVPISGIAGDQQSALFGQACFSEGMSKNTYGTGSFVLTNTGDEHSISKNRLLTTIAWGVGGKVSYALEGAIFITGAAVQWLRDGLGIISSSSEVGPLAGSVGSTEGVYFVPAMVGLGAPHWDPHARGTITGITRGTTRAHIARAAIEAMAYQTKDVVEAMTKDSGVALAELRVDGGASVMDLLCQFQADILGFTVRRPLIQETTAMGAAYLAGLAEGVWAGLDEVAAHWKLDREFEPRMSRDEAGALHTGWSEAVERTRS